MSAQDTKEKTINLSALVPVDYDDIQLTYTGDNPTTITYKRKGATVCILTLTYSGDNLIEVSSSISG